MKDVILRWSLIAVAALAIGPSLSWLCGIVQDAQGGHATTLFVSSSPVVSAVAGVVAIVIAGVFGLVAGRLTNASTGLFCAGAAIGWPAFTGSVAEGLIRVSQSSTSLWILSAEGLLVAVLGLAGAGLILRQAGPSDDDAEVIGSQAALAASITFLVGAIVAWAIAREGTPGQVLAAAGLGSIFAIAGGRSVAPSASILVCVGAALLVSVLGPAAGAILQGGDVVQASYANGLFPLARITPLHWLAGVWMGAPLGGAWAASMLEKKGESAGDGVPRRVG